MIYNLLILQFNCNPDYRIHGSSCVKYGRELWIIGGENMNGVANYEIKQINLESRINISNFTINNVFKLNHKEYTTVYGNSFTAKFKRNKYFRETIWSYGGKVNQTIHKESFPLYSITPHLMKYGLMPLGPLSRYGYSSFILNQKDIYIFGGMINGHIDKGYFYK